ncbi:MAG: hypothetical protein OEV78_01870 [Spirochaetia bacterium]|nr:hypothetical protein [Spirochaetia bacterium]
MEINMQEKWKYIDEREGDFPEAYLLNEDGHKIKVEVNREKKQIKIFAETKDGEIIESSITNGVVLDEKNCRSGRKEDLIEEFTAIGKYIGSIPDGKVIRLIGGNYGVLSEFIGRASQYVNEDIKILKRLFQLAISLPALIFFKSILFLKYVADQPRISDIVDAGIIITGGYLTYLVNFNYVAGGFALIVGALASGYLDWLVRKREPYILKVLIISIPAFYAITIGIRYQ